MKTFKTLLATVLTLSLFLHLVTLWREKDNIAAAHGDFIIFYTGAQMVLDGKARNLYDLNLQKDYQAGFDVPFRPDPLPYNHPAYELLLFLPLARLSYTDAFIGWAAFNILLVMGIARLLASVIDRENRKLAALLCAAFFPVTATIWHGQDSILSAFLLSSALVSLRRGHTGLAGIVLALGLYKPQLVVPIAVVFALKRRWEVVLPFVGAGGFLVCISILMTGWSGALQYIRLLSWINQTHYAIDPLNMANLRGLFENLSHIMGIPRVILFVMTAAGSILTVYWSSLQWKEHGFSSNSMFDLFFSHLVATTLLASYHLYIHDLTLLLIPLVALLNHGMTERPGAAVARNAVLLALVVFSVPWVSLFFPLRRMSWAALGLLAIAAILSYEMGPGRIERRKDAKPSPSLS